MRDIVGPHPRVVLDWTPDWSKERTLDSGHWTLDHHKGGPWTGDPCFVHIRKKWRERVGKGATARERLRYFLTRARSGIPDSGIPYD